MYSTIDPKFSNSDKDRVIEFAEKYEKENLIKQTKDLEICRLIECFNAKEYRNEGGYNIKESLIKCLKPLKNRKQTLINAIIFLNQNKEEVECCMSTKNTEELIEVLIYNVVMLVLLRGTGAWTSWRTANQAIFIISYSLSHV